MSSELTLKPPVAKYPQTDPKVWGEKYWFYFHENASLYPEQPTPEDVQKEQAQINYFVTHLPCKASCVPNAQSFVQNNPPDLSNKKAYFAWTIQFHNEINKETGDEERIDDPEELLGDTECRDCRIPQVAKVDAISHDADARFTDSVKSYKEAVRALVKETYQKEGKEPPEVIFNKCIDGSDTSCAVVVKNKDGTEKHLTFYHPRDLVKTIFHEVDHHIDARSGKSIDDSLNDKANQYASEMIKKYFPLDQAMMDEKGNITIAHDTTIIRDSVPIPTAAAASTSAGNPAAMVQEVYGAPNQFASDPNDPRILSDFPHLKQTLMEMKKEELKNEIREFEHKGGVLSHLDRVYEYPAQWAGLKPEELNILHTPTILANIMSTLASAFLSPLTRTLATSLFGIALMLIGVGIHSRIPTRDIMLIQALGSQLTWGGTIQALNPKLARRVKHDFQRISDEVKEKKFHVSSLVETPEQEDAAFKPQVFNPTFEDVSAFPSRNTRGTPIPQGRSHQSTVSEASNPEERYQRSGNVIKLPKFSSRSHNYFF